MDHRPPSIKVDKPWGRFEQYTHNLPSTVKIITVAPGGTLSRQYHHRRDELWVILDKGAQVQLGEEVLEPETGEKIFIPEERFTGSPRQAKARCGYWRSPSASSMRRTSSGSMTSTVVWRDNGSGLDPG